MSIIKVTQIYMCPLQGTLYISLAMSCLIFREGLVEVARPLLFAIYNKTPVMQVEGIVLALCKEYLYLI